MHAFKHGKAGSFIQIEPRLSLTAGNADEWVRNTPGSETRLAMAILRVILDERLQAPGTDVGPLKAAVRGIELESVARESGGAVGLITKTARSFAKAKPSLAIGGGVAVTGADATHLQVVIHLLNYAVGNIGKTVRFGQDSAFGKASPYREMLGLAQAMAKGEIEILLLYRVNPLFTLPEKAGIAVALKKVPFVVSISDTMDETTSEAHLVLPDLHPLEAWGDYSPEAGVYGLMQPTMAPVPGFQPKGFGDLLLSVGKTVLGAPEGKGPLRWESFKEYLVDRWKALAKEVAPGKPFDSFWEESLRQGGVWKPVPPSGVQLSGEALKLVASHERPGVAGEGLALIAYPSTRLYDGRGANKPWLQEAPDTMTQISCDSLV